MDLKLTYSEEEIANIKKAKDEQLDLYKKELKKAFETPPPSVFKTAKMLAQEEQAKTDIFINFLQEDIKMAIEFYKSECSKIDLPHFNQIIDKIKSQANIYTKEKSIEAISEEDCEFLEELAKSKLKNGFNEEASCMYRFLTRIKFSYSGAWVGWAICEQEQQHLEIVDYIYQLAGEVLPYDYYICLFAADFYIATNQKEKAKELLDKAKLQLETDQMEDSKTYEDINLLLNKL